MCTSKRSLHPDPVRCWAALGACCLPFGLRGGLAEHELQSIVGLRPTYKSRACGRQGGAAREPADRPCAARTAVKPSDSWPFGQSAPVDELLAVAERLAAQFMQRSDIGVPPSARCCAYQYGFRDTAFALGVLSETHADNVGASDAVRDFAPTLHRLIEERSAATEPGARPPCGARGRDETLCAVVQGAHALVRGFNVWILLEDDGVDYPLLFADLEPFYAKWPRSRGAPTAADPGPDGVYECASEGVAGTRRLKPSVHEHAQYRTAPAMLPGDAFIFETWGPHAAYHAGASRVPLPGVARRRSVEVRVAVVVDVADAGEGVGEMLSGRLVV